MKLNEFILREIALANSDKRPDLLALRFGQLQANIMRSKQEEQEYRRLMATMTSRWRWLQASREARSKLGKNRHPEAD
jgi:hypothetical protein